jgi:hypothetical protein
MENRILLDTLKYLEGRDIKAQLTELHLTNFFTTVELDDGSIGASMSYDHYPDNVLDVLEDRLRHHCVHPFAVQDVETLRKTVAEHLPDMRQRDYIVASLTASIASALSAPFIRSGGDEWFEVTKRRPENWTKDAETALVVGFGGFLKPLITEQDKVKNIHVIDLYYDRKTSGFREELAALAAQHPEKCVTGSTHLESAADLQRFDLISITGSTLCNGTLEYFLTNVRSDAIVILQGQSASLHPKALFEAGVSWVATTLKPPTLVQLARGGHDGEAMRPMLQGGLPWIYLLPRRAL